jgi:hypothetical protein
VGDEATRRRDPRFLSRGAGLLCALAPIRNTSPRNGQKTSARGPRSYSPWCISIRSGSKMHGAGPKVGGSSGGFGACRTGAMQDLGCELPRIFLLKRFGNSEWVTNRGRESGPDGPKESLSRPSLTAKQVRSRRLRLFSKQFLERLYEKASCASQPPHHEATHSSVHERFATLT